MSKWISVDDKHKPEEGGEVLVKFESNPFNLMGMGVSMYSEFAYPYFTHDRIHKNKVTHWMPLPEPPEEV